MGRSKSKWWALGLAALGACGLGLAAPHVNPVPSGRPAAPPAAGVPDPDVRKQVIELPTKALIAGQSPPAPAPAARPADERKRVAEGPVKNVVARAAAVSPAPPPGAGGFINPKVEPGKVRWHPDFETACAAAAKSGKPVLLFQLLGKLDDRFC